MIWRYEPGNWLSINAVVSLNGELQAGCTLADDEAGVVYVLDDQANTHDTVVSTSATGARFVASAAWQNELGVWALKRLEGRVTITLNHPNTGELMYQTGQRYSTEPETMFSDFGSCRSLPAMNMANHNAITNDSLSPTGQP